MKNKKSVPPFQLQDKYLYQTWNSWYINNIKINSKLMTLNDKLASYHGKHRYQYIDTRALAPLRYLRLAALVPFTPLCWQLAPVSVCRRFTSGTVVRVLVVLCCVCSVWFYIYKALLYRKWIWVLKEMRAYRYFFTVANICH